MQCSEDQVPAADWAAKQGFMGEARGGGKAAGGSFRGGGAPYEACWVGSSSMGRFGGGQHLGWAEAGGQQLHGAEVVGSNSIPELSNASGRNVASLHH